jgi:RNA polymerase sigma-70 factor, ECF subfamily
MAQENLSFQQIYDEFKPRILHYLTSMSGESEAEDLTQEVFVKVNQAMEGFRGDAQLSTWIYKIATNVAMDRYRRGYGREDRGIPIEGDITERVADQNSWTGEETVTSEERVIRREMNGCIREVIDTLPDVYRVVIVLSEIENLKDYEIASVLGISLQATKIRLHRARTKLKEMLSSACVFYRDHRNELACDRKNDLVNIEDSSE